MFLCSMVSYSGYMSPEYAIDGLYSTKSDVFSFGVLLLEIVSGKRNRGFSHPDHSLNLLGHVSIRVISTSFHHEKSTADMILNSLGLDTVHGRQVNGAD